MRQFDRSECIQLNYDPIQLNDLEKYICSVGVRFSSQSQLLSALFFELLPVKTVPSAIQVVPNFRESFSLMDSAERLYAEVAVAAQAKCKVV